jgi:hypothetical protein
MDDRELKRQYGEEYPAAVTIFGVRMLLEREGRFARHYHSKERNAGTTISRFQDGSATITLEQLRTEWDSWSGRERHDFCAACSWLGEQADFPEMLRFIMSQPQPQHWSSVALEVAHHLPQEEAFTMLAAALRRLDDHTANITQGIAATKHPNAKALLSEHLTILWQRPELWLDDPFTNWHAFDAICCIAHLLELGVSPQEYEDKVRLLCQHACEGNRKSCSTFLHGYYDWIPNAEVPPFAA